MLITIVCVIQLIQPNHAPKTQNLTFHLTQVESEELAEKWNLDSFKDARFRATACAHINDVRSAIDNQF